MRKTQLDYIEMAKRWLGEKFFATGWFLSEAQFRVVQDKDLMGLPVILLWEPDGQVSITPIIVPKPCGECHLEPRQRCEKCGAIE